MLIRYYEAAVLTGVGHPGRAVVLDDLHKGAWSIYTGSGEHTIPKGTPRPFIFSADEVPGRPGVYLFKIRSAQSFPNAKAKQMSFDEGDTLTIGYRFEGTRSRVVDYTSDGKPINKRLTVRDDDIEDEVIIPQLSRAGLEALAPEKVRERAYKHKNVRWQKAIPPIWHATAECVVSDPMRLADFWTRGVSSKKAYGFGMLHDLSGA